MPSSTLGKETANAPAPKASMQSVPSSGTSGGSGHRSVNKEQPLAPHYSESKPSKIVESSAPPASLAPWTRTAAATRSETRRKQSRRRVNPVPNVPAVQLEATITCPRCKHTERVTMPVNACQRFHRCEACAYLMKPRRGDCCVFCSYADTPCPPRQAEQASEP